ncbi:MAG: flagellar hook-basal body complex protein [Terracidiphilus sp.]|jgi:flagellar hook protein FlgE
MASFYIPLSGLNADSTALNTIANDLSNMSTTAFKTQTTNFSTLFSQQLGSSGSGDAIQLGEGVQVSSNETSFTQGSSDTTGNSTDMELNGNGFFVLNAGGTNVLTRAGDFTVASSGNLTSSDGLNVMGYPAVNGVVNTNGALTPITIPVGQVEAPLATTSFGLTSTLDSAAAVGTVVPGQVQVYDSMGKSYEATVTYTKQATNSWTYNVSMPDTLTANSTTAGNPSVTTIDYNFGSSGGTLAMVDPGTNLTITGPAGGSTATISAPPITANEKLGAVGTAGTYADDLQNAINGAGLTGVTVTTTAGQLSISGAGITTSGSVIQDPIASANANGTLNFDASGNLVSPAADVSGISFAGLSDGANTLNMTWNILGTNGTPTISQVDATSNGASATVQNGYASGTYQSFTVGADGTVTATYSNGEKQNVGQLALANVANLQGLQALGNSEYATTLASGTAAIGTSGTGGLGTVTDGALEMSNVNISSEFSDLIIAQRAFEASSKAVTTFDTITQETINMIH